MLHRIDMPDCKYKNMIYNICNYINIKTMLTGSQAPGLALRHGVSHIFCPLGLPHTAFRSCTQEELEEGASEFSP